MEFTATTSGIALPHILKYLKENNATGALTVSYQEANSTIWFRDGNIFFARASFSINLREAIVLLDLMTEEKLLELKKENNLTSIDDSNLDKILVDNNLIKPQYITYIRAHQIAETMYAILEKDKVSYEFHDGNTIFLGKDNLLPVNYDWLAEITYAINSWQRTREKLGSAKQVYAKNPYKTNEQITPEETRLFNLVDGKSQLWEIIFKSGFKYFNAHTVLLSLYEREIITLIKKEKFRPSVLKSKNIIEQLRVLYNAPSIKNAFIIEKTTQTIVQDDESRKANNVTTDMSSLFSKIIVDFESNLPTENAAKIKQILIEQHDGEKILLLISGSIILVTEALADCDLGLLRLLSGRAMTGIYQLLTTS